MLKIILLLKWKSLKSQLQYPANFLIAVAGISVIGVTDILLILIPTSAFETIGGWGFWELGFMFSLWKMSHGIHQALFSSFWGHDNLVRNGEYDRFLVRPAHPIWQILTSGFSIGAITEWLPSVTMFIITSSQVAIEWNVFNILFLLIILFSGAVIEWAVSLFISGFSFWFVQTQHLRGTAHTFLFRAMHYPSHIFGRAIPFILTFVFPYAFMSYYPTHYFFAIDSRIYSDFFPYATPLVAIIALAIGFAFWSIGLRNYQSTGT
ncbi:MAG: hypothetical protein DWQ07_25300 [Chloroflexi bacterium]|nr:MAG: hypothetical protein DWQ07_25300 [Chloroflexota bacterium]MBL1196147.1 hypothetical protein [Chloroflexota bacterium]NOH13440.1 hypothetical protein [Chloroflexota bacterium]